jgi:hypothetical protein
VEIGLKGVLLTFVGLVIGIALLTSVANSQVQVTQLYTVTNETLTLVNGTAVQLGGARAPNMNIQSIGTIYNATNKSTVLTSGTNYTLDLPRGTVTMIVAQPGQWNVSSYTYYQIGDSTSRSLTGLLAIFVAVAVLGVALVYLLPWLRELDVFK